MVYCDEHGLFYCLDIVIANNKKDRRGTVLMGRTFEDEFACE